jgi:hypothetical protein
MAFPKFKAGAAGTEDREGARGIAGAFGIPPNGGAEGIERDRFPSKGACGTAREGACGTEREGACGTEREGAIGIVDRPLNSGAAGIDREGAGGIVPDTGAIRMPIAGACGIDKPGAIGIEREGAIGRLPSEGALGIASAGACGTPRERGVTPGLRLVVNTGACGIVPAVKILPSRGATGIEREGAAGMLPNEGAKGIPKTGACGIIGAVSRGEREGAGGAFPSGIEILRVGAWGTAVEREVVGRFSTGAWGGEIILP